MSVNRIQARVKAVPVSGHFQLPASRLVFNKVGRDGSAKANIIPDKQNVVYGRVFELSDESKSELDEVEGSGYICQQVEVVNNRNVCLSAYCYVAVDTGDNILPFNWYLTHIIRGAKEACLPVDYIQLLSQVNVVLDTDIKRCAVEMAIHEEP